MSKQDYHKAKSKLKQDEKDNYDKLILIPCNGSSLNGNGNGNGKNKDNDNWYELAEHSAVFYYYKVCQPLGAVVTFYSDTDSYVVQYDLGFIRCHGLDAVRSRLKKVGLYDREYTQSGCYFFTLNTHFTKAETDRLIEQEISRRATNQSIVSITHSDPLLHQPLRELSEYLHHVCETQLTRMSATVNGAEILGLIDSTLIYYYELCGRRTAKITSDDWIYFGKNINALITKLELMSEAKLLPRRSCLHLAGIAVKTKEYITRKYAIARARERKADNATQH
ncbi:hypothetical protein IJ118_00580 [Candidatus Saccharibacteria bacterium]|nr:hypothetical protein [Candidatus Saccharibacteria bacterium]